MPRRTVVVEDDEDAMPLNELLRTGEASRLRRRGAMRATAHRRDDDDDMPAQPLHRRIRVDEVYLELSCGARSAECSFSPAGPSRPSPLPRSPKANQAPDAGFVFSSTGCGAPISTRALPGLSAHHHIYTATELSNTLVTHLPAKYLEPEQRSLAEFLTKEECGCQCEWEAIGCCVCGNTLGFLYAPCHPGHADSHPTYVFFPDSVTPSPNYTFPPVQTRPDDDDMSIDSPAFSPRVTRFPRPEEEFWPDGPNPIDSWATWQPNPAFAPTPPYSPSAAATPMAFTSWQSPTSIALAPPVSAPAQTSRTTNAPPTPPERPRRESVRSPSTREQAVSDGAGRAREDWGWGQYLRPVSPRRSSEPQERPLQSPSEPVHSEESHVQPLPLNPWMPREQREWERPSGVRAQDRLGLVFAGRPETAEGNARPLDPPALHRVARRPLAPPARRPTSFDSPWRGRHTNPDAMRFVQGSEERPPRGARLTRRVSMPAPTPAPPAAVFTLLDATGERNYPPSARSSLDSRDMLSVTVEVDGDGDANAHWSRRQNESPRRERTRDVDRETEEGGEDDSEEKEEDLDERRGVERLPEDELSPEQIAVLVRMAPGLLRRE